jgi:hypothetical protein
MNLSGASCTDHKVRYGVECWCGTGFVNNISPPEGASWECDIVCPGDDNLLCGGGWRIQVYSYSQADATSTPSSTATSPTDSPTGTDQPSGPTTPTPSPTSSGPISTITASTTSAGAPHSTALPDGWGLISPCMLLDQNSTLDETWEWTSNTPSACINFCQSTSPTYTYAGVAASSFTTGLECHCGTSYNPAFAAPAVLSECNVPCAGDKTQACGGYQRIQVYTKAAPPSPSLPSGWSVASWCAVDTTTRVLANAIVSEWNATNTPESCATYCEQGGFSYAGVEFADQCICGTGFTGGLSPPGAASWDPWECNTPCTGDASILCGGPWRIQIFVKSG